MAFWKCFKYGCFIGLMGFFVGRVLPKKWFNPDNYPFKPKTFENDGKIYRKIKIQKWQSKVPDMSKIFKKLMPAKNLSGNYRERLPEMIRETCIAETVHKAIMVAGLYFLEIWHGWGGVICQIVFCLVFNLPYILIQRYNRPRLQRICNRKLENSSPEDHELPVYEI